MYLTRLLSLSSSGTILVVSQIPWFFKTPINLPIALTSEEIMEERGDVIVEPEPQNQSTPIPKTAEETPQPKSQQPNQALQSVQSTPQHPKPKRNPNLEVNKKEPEKFISRNKKIMVGNYYKKEIKDKTVSLFNSDDQDDYVYLYKLRKEERDFTFEFKSYIYQYDAIKTEDINISLFSKPAWKSPNKEDEYATKVTPKEIKELFEINMESYKIKQLLLSLSSKRFWQAHKDKYRGKDNFTSTNAGWNKPDSINDLKKLKISYFTNFKDLKDYVERKSELCVNENRACIADISELDTYDYDEYSFYNEVRK